MEKVFLVKFKKEIQQVSFSADRVEFHADHIAFVRDDGGLVAMILAELVASWNDIPAPGKPAARRNFCARIV